MPHRNFLLSYTEDQRLLASLETDPRSKCPFWGIKSPIHPKLAPLQTNIDYTSTCIIYKALPNCSSISQVHNSTSLSNQSHRDTSLWTLSPHSCLPVFTHGRERMSLLTTPVCISANNRLNLTALRVWNNADFPERRMGSNRKLSTRLFDKVLWEIRRYGLPIYR